MRYCNFKFVATISSAFWLLLLALMCIDSNVINDSIITQMQIIFYALSFFVVLGIYKTTKSKIFWIFLIALFAALITDSFNYFVFNVLNHVNYFVDKSAKLEWTLLDKALYYIDYIEIFLWHLTVLGFLLLVVRPILLRGSRFQSHFFIFSIFLASMLMVLLYLSQPGKLENFNFFSGMGFVSSIIEIGTFILSIYGLAYSKSWWLNFLLSGMVMMAVTQVSALFFYNYHIQEFIKIAYMTGSLWVILIFLAVCLIYEENDYNPEAWFISPNTLEGRLAFSSLVISCLSCVVFFIVAYSLEPISERRTLNLFIFLMSYSLIAVLAAKRVAHFFSEPFQRLQENVGKFITSTNFVEKPDLFDIAEFDFLQQVIYERFMERESQNKKIKQMADRAVQIAHDIRSPASAIMMLVKDNDVLPEEQRISLRSAAIRVQDIANNLLSDHGRSMAVDSVVLMVVPAVMSVISEKRAQYHGGFCKFGSKIEQSVCFSHVKLDPVEFKCILSNLLNNAIESIPPNKAGDVEVSINTINNKVVISIVDNGCGMDDVVLNLLKSGGAICSTKKFGFGIGLTQAINFIKNEGGEIEISSIIDFGTKIDIVLPCISTPCWLADDIRFNAATHVIILDDDIAIHGAWDKRFSQWSGGDFPIKIMHFYLGSECVDYINSLDGKKENILLLADYELLNQKISGLDVIQMVDVGQAILVTSYYDDVELIKRSILLNAKILPKMIAADVKLVFDYNHGKVANLGNCILLDDQVELSEVIQYLAKAKKLNLDCYSTPYDLWAVVGKYPYGTPICIDYDLGLPINGIDVAEKLHLSGYTKLYLATGYHTKQEDIPPYLTAFSSKMALLNFNFDSCSR